MGLITITRQQILDWFDIPYSAFEQTTQLKYQLGLDDVIIETENGISLETLRLVAEGLLEKFQNGLTFTELENLLFFLVIIRFLTLLFRFNLKTAFLICCISMASGYLWYRHLVDLILYFKPTMLSMRVTRQFAIEVNNMALYYQAQNALASPNYIASFFNALRVAWVEGDYNIDPLSLFISQIPVPYNGPIFDLYYVFTREILPFWYRFFAFELKYALPLFYYVWIVRVGKKYVPYHCRWHWTFLTVNDTIQRVFAESLRREYNYKTDVLLPKLDELYKVTENFITPTGGVAGTSASIEINKILREYDTLTFYSTLIVCSCLILAIYGVLHALFGQYFYIPFITENTELHIGPKRQTIYSGGWTSWQDRKTGLKTRIIPQLWYGWFGRGTDTLVFDQWPIIGNYTQDLEEININRFLKKTRKRLKKFFKKSFRKSK